MAAVEILLELALRFGKILAAPIVKPDLLWLLIPIYLNWVLTDYYQERKGTHFGNAFTNGFVALWVGMDWIRTYLREPSVSFSPMIQIGVSSFFIAYGLFIMLEAARGKSISKYVGRIREVSYVYVALTPVFYGIVVLDLVTIGAILLFFPIFYILSEILNKVLPAPPSDDEMPDMKDMGKDFGTDLGGSGSGIGADTNNIGIGPQPNLGNSSSGAPPEFK